MKELSKHEVKSILGKESTWTPKRLVSKLNYISGVLPYDELLDGKLFTEVVALINFIYRPNGLHIQMMKGFKNHSVGILNDSIETITLENRDQLYEQKEKSVIGRAIIGGLIFGPVGAIIGGMTGMGTKQLKAEMPEVLLSIRYAELGETKMLVFSCSKKNSKAVNEFLRSNYSEKFKSQRVINKINKPIVDNSVDELYKLIEMKENGFLTEDEFKLMKQKLIK